VQKKIEAEAPVDSGAGHCLSSGGFIFWGGYNLLRLAEKVQSRSSVEEVVERPVALMRICILPASKKHSTQTMGRRGGGQDL
jgi:hypothetical protein